MSEEDRKTEPLNFSNKPGFQPSGRFTPGPAQEGPLTRPDFENNLAGFRHDFFQFVTEADPDFNLELIQNNPAPPPPPAPTHPATEEVWHPTRKEEMSGPLRLSGPKVITGDILGDQVQLLGDVRVKGTLFGRNSAHIGPGCVIEGHVISGGPVKIDAGSRVEGAVVGLNVSLAGPVYIQGPVVSRQNLETIGSVEAQALYAGTNLALKGSLSDEVRVEAALILAKAGNLDVTVPVKLAKQPVDVERQKFYLAVGEGGNVILTPVSELGQILPAGSSHTTVLTTLTDADLENLLAELEKL
ncbi:MAG: hypothetical protein J0I20_28145 [Chloroflexi bacterium]|nr:hypothetical protein [Chloroflexota bacterium]OJV97558.1 MAG: hypothetical protein BGO39_07275 [Chloroflexi bacterium 54-19]